MAVVEFITHPDGHRLACRYCQGDRKLTVVFLGGFNSSMDGDKALAIENWCQKLGYSSLCFDYRAHGKSEGLMMDACLGDWIQDSLFLIRLKTRGPLILVGSSMGCWIMFSCLSGLSEVKAVMGIASAPDFTEVNLIPRFSKAQAAELDSKGYTRMPSEYDAKGYLVTRKLISEARSHLLLDKDIDTAARVVLIHGTGDDDISCKSSQLLFDVIDSPLKSLILLQGADHRMSDSRSLSSIISQLKMLTETIESDCLMLG